VRFSGRSFPGSIVTAFLNTPPPKRMPRFKSDEDLFRDSTMTFGEHLEELRVCLWRALIGLMLGFLLGLFVSPQVVDGIQTPLRKALQEHYHDQSVAWVEAHKQELHDLGYPEHFIDRVDKEGLLPETVFISPHELRSRLSLNLADEPAMEEDRGDLAELILWKEIAKDKRVRTSALNAHEPFMIFVKGGMLVGAILSSPWIFWQIWTFVAAGLYKNEKRYVHLFMPISFFLFASGVILAFFFVFGPVLKFLFTFNDWLHIDPDVRISEWTGFVLMLPLGFGISFQLPLVMLFMERIGLFSVEAYLTKWRIAILVIFVISMFLTPADPQSMLLMAIPLTVLYFLGILFCKHLPKARSPFDEPDDESQD
jgi:sec-independent protein translocase protein TatC